MRAARHKAAHPQQPITQPITIQVIDQFSAVQRARSDMIVIILSQSNRSGDLPESLRTNKPLFSFKQSATAVDPVGPTLFSAVIPPLPLLTWHQKRAREHQLPSTACTYCSNPEPLSRNWFSVPPQAPMHRQDQCSFLHSRAPPQRK